MLDAVWYSLGTMSAEGPWVRFTSLVARPMRDSATNHVMTAAKMPLNRRVIIPVKKPEEGAEQHNYDVVGPICETGDFLGKDRELSLSEGALVAVRSSGAYGFAMASNYNTRPRACELLVDGDQVHQIRRRETIEELFAGESLLP